MPRVFYKTIELQIVGWNAKNGTPARLHGHVIFVHHNMYIKVVTRVYVQIADDYTSFVNFFCKINIILNTLKYALFKQKQLIKIFLSLNQKVASSATELYNIVCCLIHFIK